MMDQSALLALLAPALTAREATSARPDAPVEPGVARWPSFPVDAAAPPAY